MRFQIFTQFAMGVQSSAMHGLPLKGMYLWILSELVCSSLEHYADDLEVDLQEAMEEDFHMVLEDGSPLQV